MRRILSILKIISLLLIISGLFSCSGLREHVRQRQLETHGPPKGIKDQRNNNQNNTRKDNTRKDNNRNSDNSVYTKYSEKWGVELSGNENTEFIKAIDSWLGTPYVYGGESKKGTDCSGMIQTLYMEIYNIPLQRSANGMQKDVRFISINKAKLGDILFFKINYKTVGHVALYLGNRKFIHATVNKGVMISCLDELYYSTRYYKCGRIMAMETQ